MSPSSSIVAEVIDFVSVMLQLMEDRRWDDLEDFALSDPNTFTLISRALPSCEEFSGMSILHAMVRYNPPTCLLDKMIRLHPEALSVRDCLGRTPLHVAAGSEISPRSIKLMVIKYPEACTLQDEDLRTPLHIACDSSCELFEDDEEVRGSPDIDTIRVLIAGSLDAVAWEDIDEMNAVEYAILSDADMKVVTLLQKATQRVQKKKMTESSHTTGCSPTKIPIGITFRPEVSTIGMVSGRKDHNLVCA